MSNDSIRWRRIGAIFLSFAVVHPHAAFSKGIFLISPFLFHANWCVSFAICCRKGRKKLLDRGDSILIWPYFDVVLFFLSRLGEHPAAMQRGCANANIDMSIVLYIVTLSMLLQQLNRITHGYGVSYDVIRWFSSITSPQPKTIPSSFHCQHQIEADCSSLQASANAYRAAANQITVNSVDCVACIVRWKPNNQTNAWTMERILFLSDK